MRKLPMSIPELDGGLFVPRQVTELLEAVLVDYASLAEASTQPGERRAVLAELRELLHMGGSRPALPPAREQLALPDPQVELLARNLVKG